MGRSRRQHKLSLMSCNIRYTIGTIDLDTEIDCAIESRQSDVSSIIGIAGFVSRGAQASNWLDDGLGRCYFPPYQDWQYCFHS